MVAVHVDRHHLMMKISIKLTIQILMIAVIPLLILGGVALSQMALLAEQDFFDKVSQDADFHQQQIEEHIHHQQRKVESLATASQTSAILSRILSSIDEELLPSPAGESDIDRATKAYLDHYFWREAPGVLQDDSFSDLFLLSMEGELLYAYDEESVMGRTLTEGGELSQLYEIWERVKLEETVIVEGYREDPFDEGVVMYVASPIYSWSELIGVVIVEYGAAWVEEMLVQSTLLGDTEDLVVLVNRGGEASFIRNSRFMSLEHPCRSSSSALLDQVLVPELDPILKGVGWRVDSRCLEVVADWRHLESINATMVVTLEKSEVLEGYIWFRTLFIWLISVVIFIILLVSYSASRMITRRVVRLKEHALEIATGDLQQRIGDYGSDEVGMLADALRSMMKTIRDRTRTLEQTNQRMHGEELLREELIRTRTQELFEAKSYMEKILATMRDVLVVSDCEGRIKMLNPAATELLGYGEAELLGTPVLEIFQSGTDERLQIFKPEQVEPLQQNLRELVECDGRCLQRLVENSPIAVLVTLESGTIDIANSEAEQLFGYPRGALDACNIELLLPQLDQAQLIAVEGALTAVEGEKQGGGRVTLDLIVTSMNTAQGVRTLWIVDDGSFKDFSYLAAFTPFGRLFFVDGQLPEVELKGHDGETIPVLLSGETLRDRKQSCQGFVLVMWDLRERKALEAKSNEAAYQGGLGEMSATILHNIGNVITGLGGSAHRVRKQLDDLLLIAEGLQRLQQLLQGDEIEPERVEQVRRGMGQASDILKQIAEEKMGQDLDGIDKGIQHVADIITLQQGLVRGGVWATEFSLHEAIGEAVAMQALSLEKSQIVCHQQLQAEVDRVRLPRGPLQQMLVNLIKNGREAIEQSTTVEGEIRVQVGALTKGGEVKQFQLIVSDNGGGIEESVRRQIFDSGFTTKSTGNGLGLHSAATFAQSVGGEIEVRNGVHGAEFVVTLPVWFREG